MADMLRGQAKMMDYDAICTFVFKDYKDFAKFMLSLIVSTVTWRDRYDPASKALTPDHDNFMIEDDMQMMIGDELVDHNPHSCSSLLTRFRRYMIIEDGQKVDKP
jgi:hypothetical protein